MAAPEGSSPALTILIRPEGQIHIVDGAESPIEALQQQFGCGSAFRVTRYGGQVRVEGRSGSNRCVIENPRSEKPKASKAYAGAALGLFIDRPAYCLAQPALCA
jgi:hypothetical protein